MSAEGSEFPASPLAERACWAEFWVKRRGVTWPLLQPQAEEAALGGERIPEAEQEAESLGRASPSDLTVANATTTTEENGEQEGEPLRNGSEEVSEREGGCAESVSEVPVCQPKPGSLHPRPGL